MTKEYSLKKKNHNWQTSLLVVLALLLIAAAALLFSLSKKPNLQFKQVDLSVENNTQNVTTSFTIAILNNNVVSTRIINKNIQENDKYLVILNSLKENMDWPAAVMVDGAIGLEHKQKRYAIVNMAIDRHQDIEISVSQERDILNSIGQTLKLNGIDDFRVLINGKESSVFIKHLSLKIGLD